MFSGCTIRKKQKQNFPDFNHRRMIELVIKRKTKKAKHYKVLFAIAKNPRRLTARVEAIRADSAERSRHMCRANSPMRALKSPVARVEITRGELGSSPILIAFRTLSTAHRAIQRMRRPPG